MNHELKNYRAPRNPWPWILTGAVIVAALTFVGPADFASELAMEAEAKILRAIQTAPSRDVNR